jgi:hypothetical protein
MVILVFILFSFLIFIVPNKLKPYLNILQVVALAGWSTFFAIQVLLSGVPYTEILPVTFWGHNIELIIDLCPLFLSVLSILLYLQGRFFPLSI